MDGYVFIYFSCVCYGWMTSIVTSLFCLCIANFLDYVVSPPEYISIHIYIYTTHASAILNNCNYN